MTDDAPSALEGMRQAYDDAVRMWETGHYSDQQRDNAFDALVSEAQRPALDAITRYFTANAAFQKWCADRYGQAVPHDLVDLTPLLEEKKAAYEALRSLSRHE